MSKAPICPECGDQMVERTRRDNGEKFYGCIHWPRCTETADHEDTDTTSFGDHYNGIDD